MVLVLFLVCIIVIIVAVAVDSDVLGWIGISCGLAGAVLGLITIILVVHGEEEEQYIERCEIASLALENQIAGDAFCIQTLPTYYYYRTTPQGVVVEQMVAGPHTPIVEDAIEKGYIDFFHQKSRRPAIVHSLAFCPREIDCVVSATIHVPQGTMFNQYKIY